MPLIVSLYPRFGHRRCQHTLAKFNNRTESVLFQIRVAESEVEDVLSTLKVHHENMPV